VFRPITTYKAAYFLRFAASQLLASPRSVRMFDARFAAAAAFGQQTTFAMSIPMPTYAGS
jgi:hypothetical protein